MGMFKPIVLPATPRPSSGAAIPTTADIDALRVIVRFVRCRLAARADGSGGGDAYVLALPDMLDSDGADAVVTLVPVVRGEDPVPAPGTFDHLGKDGPPG